MKKRKRILCSAMALCLAVLLTGCVSRQLKDPDTGGGPMVDEKNTDVAFAAQYIRTDGCREDVAYPVVKIIRSAQELTAYYEQYKEMYSLERREDPASDSTVGFLDACDQYDDAYFEKQCLVMVLLQENSGSNRHKVKSVSLLNDTKLTVDIERIVPEAGTCDMAAWHILIEPEAGVELAGERDVTVLVDGVDPLMQPVRAQHSRGYANIFLNIPKGWEYETEDKDGSNDFCIAFWPAGQSEGKIKVWYYEAFGVCGTGLKQENITLSRYEAYQSTYDNKAVWDFISLKGVPGQYVVINEGADTWWSEYGEEAMDILNTLVVGENIISQAEAIAVAEKEVTVAYNQTRTSFDIETGCWTVTFCKKNTAGGDQTFTITHEGKIVNIAYGE